MQPAMYAIIDIVSGIIINNIIMIERNPAAAVRTFTDLAANPKTSIGQHPADHQLICLGYLTDDHHIETESEPIKHEVIITGQAWLATQQPAADTELRIAK